MVLVGRVLTLLAVPAGLLAAAAKGFAVLERPQEEQGRSEAEQEAQEEYHRYKRIHRTAEYVDQKLRQQHQRDEDEEQREGPHDAII